MCGGEGGSMDVDVSALLNVVPAQYWVYIALALKVLFSLNAVSSYLAPLVKKRFGADSAISHVFDFVAVNTQRAKDTKVITDLKQRVGLLEASGLLKSEALKANDDTIKRQAELIKNSVPLVKS